VPLPSRQREERSVSLDLARPSASSWGISSGGGGRGGGGPANEKSSASQVDAQRLQAPDSGSTPTCAAANLAPALQQKSVHCARVAKEEEYSSGWRGDQKGRSGGGDRERELLSRRMTFPPRRSTKGSPGSSRAGEQVRQQTLAAGNSSSSLPSQRGGAEAGAEAGFSQYDSDESRNVVALISGQGDSRHVSFDGARTGRDAHPSSTELSRQAPSEEGGGGGEGEAFGKGMMRARAPVHRASPSASPSHSSGAFEAYQRQRSAGTRGF